ncbi:MAG: T9SS type A sorting domain-containing protein [Candidatus Azobacteroides sp.]|nr:T9SS type A sorting domain-containing protein [Candidatus Azobacteroides sp.]
MKKFYSSILIALLAILTVQANESVIEIRTSQSPALRASGSSFYENPDTLRLYGNNDQLSFIVSAKNLNGKTLQISTTRDFILNRTEITGDTEETEVTVQLKGKQAVSKGEVIFFTENFRFKYQVVGYATPLDRKDISTSPVLTGDANSYEFTESEGFTPSENGYTIEFKAKALNLSSYIYPYAITREGIGFKGWVNQEDLGLFYGTGELDWLRKTFSNETKSEENGGLEKFVDDGEFHTYRYAVASDNRVFVYRDGELVANYHLQDIALQPDFIDDSLEGSYEENLLHNGEFDEGYISRWTGGESDMPVANYVPFWNMDATDRWQAEQYIRKAEIDVNHNADNNYIQLNHYRWTGDPYTAVSCSQVVEVLPGETYSFSALAKTDLYKNDYWGSLRLQELAVDGSVITEKIENVTSSSWEEYAMSHTTSAAAKQIRTMLYVERVTDSWGSAHSMGVDNVKLSGKRAPYQQKLGFDSRNVEVEYFTYDLTGAYAPIEPLFGLSTNNLVIEGTGKTARLVLNPQGLPFDITAIYPPGFSGPEIISKDGENIAIDISYDTYLVEKTGQLILKSGNHYAYIDLTGKSNFEQKDISGSPVYSEGTSRSSFEVTEAEGFTPDMSKGYTLEFRIKSNHDNSRFSPYAITWDGTGFMSFFERERFGMESQSFGTWDDYPFVNEMYYYQGGGTFYPDEEYHTYRYVVAPDKAISVYRDRTLVKSFYSTDFGLQADFIEGYDGEYVDNLLTNPDFEGYVDLISDVSSGIARHIKGWKIKIGDRWNSYQKVVNQEIIADGEHYDITNKILEMNMYEWDTAWGANEISQMVDVVPNETYTFSAMAKNRPVSSGQDAGKFKGSIRLQEIAADGSVVDEKIESFTSEDWHEYSLSYTTTGTAKQLRAVLYLERSSDQNGWGIYSNMAVNYARLTGKKNTSYAQKIGFSGQLNTDVEYFTYDLTGPYAPIDSEIIGIIVAPSAIGDVEDKDDIKASISYGILFLDNVPASSQVDIYNTNGLPVTKVTEYNGQGITLPMKGVYIITVKNGTESQSLRVIY